MGSPEELALRAENQQLRARIAERERELSERSHLAAIVEFSEDGIFSRTLDGTIISWNAGAERLFGYKAGEMVGRSISLLVPPHRHDELPWILEQLQRGEAVTRFETVRVRKDRRPIDVSVTISPLRDSSGTLIGAAVVSRDITERKQAEAQLREREERFHAIFDQAAVGIALVQPDRQWLQVNDRFCEILGYPQGELRGKTFLDITHPDDRETSLTAVRRLLAGQISSWRKEKRYIRKDGSVVWGRVLVSLVRGQDGGPQYFISILEEITEQKEFEERLGAREVQLVGAQRLARLGSWDAEFGTGRCYWSEEIFQILGLPMETRRSLSAFLDRVHSKDRDRVLNVIGAARSNRGPVEVDFRIVRPDGEGRFVHTICEVVRNDQGVPLGIVGTTQDVTEQVKGREILRESEERMKKAERLARVGNWQWDVRTNEVTGSEEMYRIFGKPADFVPTFEQFIRDIVPQDRERVQREIGKCFEGYTGYATEYLITLPNGDLRAISSLGELVRDEEGSPLYMFGACQDITDRKRNEDALRQSEERFRNMADTAPVMIGVTDSGKNCTFVNARWLEFTGAALEQSLGKGWLVSIHPEDVGSLRKVASRSFDARENFRTEYRVRRADGQYRWVLCTGLPLFSSDNVFVGYIGSCVDITDIKRVQEEAAMRQKLESIGTLAGGIAHDFNNLLGGILAATELALKELAEGAHPEHELEVIREATIRGSEIVRQLMIYAGKEVEVPVLVDVSRIVSEMLELLKLSVSKHVTLAADLGKDLPSVRATPGQVRQIVMNIITNASEAIGDRDGVIHVTTERITVGREHGGGASETLNEGDYLRLAVSDTGGGMTMEEKARVFDPFFTTKSTGQGLGLSVVDGIVRSLQGTIRLESEPGKGTTLTVLLPRAETTSRETGVQTPRIEQLSHSSQRSTILVVEDGVTLRQAVVKMLRHAGFFVIEVGDGSAALETIRTISGSIDVLLLDITLPGAPSREVFEEARRLRPGMRVIATSAYNEAMAAESLGARPEHFIRKPYRIGELTDLIRQALS